MFATEDEAKAALDAYVLLYSSYPHYLMRPRNGRVVEGHHIRVDSSTNSGNFDPKRSVFVGNIPFGALRIWHLYVHLVIIDRCF